MSRTMPRWPQALLVAALLGAWGAPASWADAPVNTVKEAAKTGAGAARDGARTFGRSTRAFFKEGPEAAKSTWKSNAAKTKANAKAGGRRTRSAARSQ